MAGHREWCAAALLIVAACARTHIGTVDIETVDTSRDCDDIRRDTRDGGETASGETGFGIRISGDRVEPDPGWTWPLPDAGACGWIDMTTNVLLMHLDTAADDGAILTDSSGVSGRAGVLVTGEPGIDKRIPGKLGSGLLFDGIDDVVEVTGFDDLRPDAPFSFAAWISPATTQGGVLAGLYDQSGAPSLEIQLLSGATATAVELAVAPDCSAPTSTAAAVDSMPEVTAGTAWTHLAVVYRPDSSLELFLNGKLNLVAPVLVESRACAWPTTLHIGARADGTSPFDGRLDEVAIWSRDLSPIEIATIFARQAPEHYGLFVGPITDQSADATWQSLAWDARYPLGKELPTEDESGYVDRNVNMQGLLGLWHLNGPAGASPQTLGGTVVPDASAFGNDATLYNADLRGVTYVQGLFNQAIAFDGVDSFARIQHQPEFLIEQGTVMLWFRVDGGSGHQGLFSKDASGLVSGGHFNLAFDASRLIGRIQGTVVSIGIASAAGSAPLGQWHHAAATFGPGGFMLFLNGTLAASNPYTGGWGLTGGGTGNVEPIDIGGLNSRNSGAPLSVTDPLRGAIDEVALFDRELSADEIATAYERGAADVRFQVRSCDESTCSGVSFVGPDATPRTFYSEALTGLAMPGPVSLADVASGRFLQYRALLLTRDPAIMPDFGPVTVTGSF